MYLTACLTSTNKHKAHSSGTSDKKSAKSEVAGTPEVVHSRYLSYVLLTEHKARLIGSASRKGGKSGTASTVAVIYVAISAIFC